MNPSVTGQQRRVVNAMVRRNLQGWGRPLDFTVQRLRLGSIFGGVGAVAFFIRQAVVNSTAAFFVSVLALLVLLCLAFFVSTLLTHIVPFVRARSEKAATITGKLEAVICDPQEYTSLARGDFYFITLRAEQGPLRAYALEAARHPDICGRGGQQVTLEVVPGIDYVVRVR